MALNLQRWIDKYVGYILILILYIIKPLKSLIKSKSNHILVIRIWTLGESLLTLPMIKELKNNDHKIDVLVTNRSKSVFQNVDFVDNIIDFSPKLLFKLLKYDYVIDTEPYFNMSALLAFYLGKRTIGFSNQFRAMLYDYKVNYDDMIHSVYNFSNLLKPLKINFKPKSLIPLNYSNDDIKYVDNLLSKHSINRLIGIHMGLAETAKYRMWKIDNFVVLIEQILNELDVIVILTGVNSDIETNDKVIQFLNNKRVINLAGKTNVSQLAYLMTKFKLFISNDTGPMHLSAAMRTKTIGLFGPNLPERFAPFGINNISISKAQHLECSPCINVHKGEFRVCPYNGKCMDLILVDDVFEQLMILLK